MSNEASFANATLDKVSFEGGNLYCADFRNATIKNSSFKHAATLQCAKFQGAHFENVDVTGADFKGVEAEPQDLIGLDLTTAKNVDPKLLVHP